MRNSLLSIHGALLFALFAALLIAALPRVRATEVLFNRAFDSGMTGWQGYSPVTWGNYGVNNDFNHNGEAGQAFWARAERFRR